MSVMMVRMLEILRIFIVNLDLLSVAMDRSKELLSRTYLYAGKWMKSEVVVSVWYMSKTLPLWTHWIWESCE